MCRLTVTTQIFLVSIKWRLLTCNGLELIVKVEAISVIFLPRGKLKVIKKWEVKGFVIFNY